VVPDPGPDNLLRIARAYQQATVALNRGPKNRDELRAYLGEVEDLDRLFRSPHDGQDFVIIWEVDFRTIPLKAGELPQVIAYERQGKDGRRDVFTAAGVIQMSEDVFRRAPFPLGHRPPLDEGQ